MNFADMVIDPRAEGDITWYLRWSEGEMGLRSSFEPMVARLQGGRRDGGAPPTEMNERQLEAASRARRISRALQNMKLGQRLVLLAAFGPEAHALPGLGHLAPVAQLTKAALEAHQASGSDRSFGEWLVRLCGRCARPAPMKRRSKNDERASAADRKTLAAIQGESEVLLQTALRHFVMSRRSWRR